MKKMLQSASAIILFLIISTKIIAQESSIVTFSITHPEVLASLNQEQLDQGLAANSYIKQKQTDSLANTSTYIFKNPNSLLNQTAIITINHTTHAVCIRYFTEQIHKLLKDNYDFHTSNHDETLGYGKPRYWLVGSKDGGGSGNSYSMTVYQQKETKLFTVFYTHNIGGTTTYTLKTDTNNPLLLEY